MSSYKDLLEKREELEKQIQEARKAEIKSAVEQIQQMIKDYELSPDDIFPPRRAPKGDASKVAPKYRNPATGDSWTGRGKPPAWIRDQDRNQFLI